VQLREPRISPYDVKLSTLLQIGQVKTINMGQKIPELGAFRSFVLTTKLLTGAKDCGIRSY
jgi:hypothetical protein